MLLSILFLAFIAVWILGIMSVVPGIVPVIVGLAWVAVAFVRLLLA